MVRKGDKVMDWNAIVIEPIRAIFIRTGAFIPKLVGILVILIIGWIVAKVLQSVVTKGLKTARFDAVSDRIGLANILIKGEVKYTLSELLGVIVYWLIMLIAFLAVANLLNLTVAAALLDKVILYLPNVIAAIFILVLGMFFANIMGAIVKTAIANAGIGHGNALSKVVQVVIMVFAAAIALEQLQIGTAIITMTFNIVLAAVGLAIAIAFGLGCKEMAGRFIGDVVDKLKKK